jgi:hypothetical protein
VPTKIAMVLGLVACSSSPPAIVEGARGELDGEPTCFLFPTFGEGRVAFDTGALLTITLSGAPDEWSHEGARVSYIGSDGCEFVIGYTGARVQWGSEPHDGRQPLYVEGVAVPGVESTCTSCTPSECRGFEPMGVDRLYLWCEVEE